MTFGWKHASRDVDQKVANDLCESFATHQASPKPEQAAAGSPYVHPLSDIVLDRLREVNPPWFKPENVVMDRMGTFTLYLGLNDEGVSGNSGGRGYLRTRYDVPNKAHMMELDTGVLGKGSSGRYGSVCMMMSAKKAYHQDINYDKVADSVDNVIEALQQQITGTSSAAAGGAAVEVDTALVYGAGLAETMLGQAVQASAHTFSVASKARPDLSAAGSITHGGLSAEHLAWQVESSLANLGRDHLDLLYLHAPDAGTPLDHSLQAAHQLYLDGKIHALGLSNFSSEDVATAVDVCRERGWLAPSVYQGLYNGINRHVEADLLPTLNLYGLRFLAYNPLAGGLLTNRYLEGSPGAGRGRCDTNESYQSRYLNEDTIRGVQELAGACAAAARHSEAEAGLTVLEASLRWLAQHSALVPERGDGVILGASGRDQLGEALATRLHRPLPASVVEAMDKAWEAAKPSAFGYARGASGALAVPLQPPDLD